MKTDISKLKSHIGKEVSINCWMYNVRGSGKIRFLQLRDGTGFVQAVASEGDLSPVDWQAAQDLTIESSLTVTGKVVEDDRSDIGVEIQLTKLEPIHIVSQETPYPIGKKEHGPEFLFDNRHLYFRSKTPWAILRIRDQFFASIESYLREQDFTRTDSPVLQPTSCEDTTQLFEVDYYDSPMYLTQSGQLYIEATVKGLKRVYDFGPVFRAEKSKTRFHLSEFWMMDAEIAFCDQQQNEDIQEGLMKRVLQDIVEKRSYEMEILDRKDFLLKMEKMIKEPFKRMKHREVKELLEKDGMEVDYKDDMTTEEELRLGEIYDVPVFIEDFPFDVKSFYMPHYTDGDIERAVCADLIAPFGGREIIGGSQREHDYDKLVAELEKRGYPKEDYGWYLDLRKYGSQVHSGFGVGPERTLRWITGVHHIRETIPFPRTVVRRYP